MCSGGEHLLAGAQRVRAGADARDRPAVIGNLIDVRLSAPKVESLLSSSAPRSSDGQAHMNT